MAIRLTYLKTAYVTIFLQSCQQNTNASLLNPLKNPIKEADQSHVHLLALQLDPFTGGGAPSYFATSNFLVKQILS